MCTYKLEFVVISISHDYLTDFIARNNLWHEGNESVLEKKTVYPKQVKKTYAVLKAFRFYDRFMSTFNF